MRHSTKGFDRSYRDIAPPRGGLLREGNLLTKLSRASGKIGINCEWCGAGFERYACWVKRRNHHFCSRGCKDAWATQPFDKVCVICNAPFRIYGNVKNERVVTCSRKCKSIKAGISNKLRLAIKRGSNGKWAKS